jgi:hypothetical protein
MNLPVYVTTCDRYLWAMRPFAYLFNTFWSSLQPVTVVGYREPDFDLPPNFDFYSAGKDGGQEHWTDGVIKFLQEAAADIFVLLLDDYWLNRKADNTGVGTLADYVAEHPDVLRLDLTTDRLYAGGMFEVESYGHYDIVETPFGTPYQMSTQAGIWRKSLLLELLKPGMSPWQVELQTQPPERMRVLGTRQNPVRYANVFKGGNPDEMLNLGQIPERHVEAMRGQGWLS